MYFLGLQRSYCCSPGLTMGSLGFTGFMAQLRGHNARLIVAYRSSQVLMSYFQ